MTRSALRFGITLVIVHALVSLVHGAAHFQLGIFLPFAANLFVAVDIVTLPLVAAVLLWGRAYRTGAVMLFISMIGAFLFGLVYHFVLDSPDHVAHAPATAWGLTFQITSMLLLIIEGAGVFAGWWLVKQAYAAPGHKLAVQVES
jgi:hypothetical protein